MNDIIQKNDLLYQSNQQVITLQLNLSCKIIIIQKKETENTQQNKEREREQFFERG